MQHVNPFNLVSHHKNNSILFNATAWTSCDNLKIISYSSHRYNILVCGCMVFLWYVPHASRVTHVNGSAILYIWYVLDVVWQNWSCPMTKKWVFHKQTHAQPVDWLLAAFPELYIYWQVVHTHNLWPVMELWPWPTSGLLCGFLGLNKEDQVILLRLGPINL